MQQGGRVEDDDVPLRRASATVQKGTEPLGVFGNVAAGYDLQRRALDPRVFRSDDQFLDLPARQADRAGFPVQRLRTSLLMRLKPAAFISCTRMA